MEKPKSPQVPPQVVLSHDPALLFLAIPSGIHAALGDSMTLVPLEALFRHLQQRVFPWIDPAVGALLGISADTFLPVAMHVLDLAVEQQVLCVAVVLRYLASAGDSGTLVLLGFCREQQRLLWTWTLMPPGRCTASYPLLRHTPGSVRLVLVPGPSPTLMVYFPHVATQQPGQPLGYWLDAVSGKPVVSTEQGVFLTEGPHPSRGKPMNLSTHLFFQPWVSHIQLLQDEGQLAIRTTMGKDPQTTVCFFLSLGAAPGLVKLETSVSIILHKVMWPRITGHGEQEWVVEPVIRRAVVSLQQRFSFVHMYSFSATGSLQHMM